MTMSPNSNFAAQWGLHVTCENKKENDGIGQWSRIWKTERLLILKKAMEAKMKSWEGEKREGKRVKKKRAKGGIYRIINKSQAIIQGRADSSQLRMLGSEDR